MIFDNCNLEGYSEALTNFSSDHMTPHVVKHSQRAHGGRVASGFRDRVSTCSLALSRSLSLSLALTFTLPISHSFFSLYMSFHTKVTTKTTWLSLRSCG